MTMPFISFVNDNGVDVILNVGQLVDFYFSEPFNKTIITTSVGKHKINNNVVHEIIKILTSAGLKVNRI